MAIPVLEPIDLAGKTVTADALLTQRKLATYLVERDAHYLFIAKDNQPTLSADIRLHFAARRTSASPPPCSMAGSKAAPSGPPPR
jgi:predicted transposase YbfD/YdcC